MPEDAHHENAFAAGRTDGAATGTSSASALSLLGRGLPQLGWAAAICLFLALFLPDFSFNVFARSLPEMREHYLKFDVWASLFTCAFEALALCWLLANIRRTVWLFLAAMSLAFLNSHIYVSILSFLYWSLATSIYTITQPWSTIVWQLILGVSSATAILVAVKLPRAFGFAIPLVAAGLKVGAAMLVSLLILRGFPFSRFAAIRAVTEGFAFGLALWIVVELQRRKRLKAERPSEARSSNGAYIFGFGFCSLLGTALLLAASPELGDAESLVAAAGVVVGMVGAIVALVFLYRAWKAIQTPYSIPAGSAIGGLFIPLYWYYWVFQAVPGYAREYENFAAHHELRLPKVNRGWLIAFAVCWIVAPMAPLASVFFTPNFPFGGVFGGANSLLTICGVLAISRISDAVNRIPLGLPDPKAAAPATASA